MTWIYYTGRTPEEEQQFLEDYKDADRIIHVRETGRVWMAEYADKTVANAAWERANQRQP